MKTIKKENGCISWYLLIYSVFLGMKIIIQGLVLKILLYHINNLIHSNFFQYIMTFYLQESQQPGGPCVMSPGLILCAQSRGKTAAPLKAEWIFLNVNNLSSKVMSGEFLKLTLH